MTSHNSNGLAQLAKTSSIDGAAHFIATHSAAEYTSAVIIQDPKKYSGEAYRRAASKLHPDAKSGDEESYKLLSRAKSLLDQHHKIESCQLHETRRVQPHQPDGALPVRTPLPREGGGSRTIPPF